MKFAKKGESETSLPSGEGLREGLISITSLASVSPLGTTLEETWNSYLDNQHRLMEKKIGDDKAWVAPLPDSAQKEIELLKASDSKYMDLDESVLYAMVAARKAVPMAGWNADYNLGINIGSSRGVTSLFEKYHLEFLLALKKASLPLLFLLVR